MLINFSTNWFGRAKLALFTGCLLLIMGCYGCAEPETEKVIPDACPDLGLLVTQADVTDMLDPYGRPIDRGNVFSSSAESIFLVFRYRMICVVRPLMCAGFGIVKQTLYR
jgi:hypothetical protein